MNTIETSLIHRVLPPVRQEPAYPLLILLHGRGADELDLLGLSDYLDDRLLIVSAQAPFAFGNGGFTWYEMDKKGMPKPSMFTRSYEALSTFVNDVINGYPVQKTNVFLLGFSMGTVMSFSLSLTQPELVRGVVANSGYVPEGTHLQFRWSEVNHHHYFIAHGIHDPVIPIGFARRANELFQKSKATVLYKEYPMVHQIGEDQLNDLSSWLTRLLDTPPD